MVSEGQKMWIEECRQNYIPPTSSGDNKRVIDNKQVTDK